jgi:hypothetical protein
VECTDTVLPVTYPKFAGMMEPGDTLYVGRYLVSGADSASLYLEVRAVASCGKGGVRAVAKGELAVAGGLHGELAVVGVLCSAGSQRVCLRARIQQECVDNISAQPPGSNVDG